MNRIGAPPIRLSQLFDDPSDVSVTPTPMCTPARGLHPSQMRTPFRSSTPTKRKSTLVVVILAIAAVVFWVMFARSVLPHQLAESDCPENAHVIKGQCILRGSPEEASVEFAAELSNVLTSQTEVRSLDALLTYLTDKDIVIPEDVDVATALNFTKNFVLSEDDLIVEKMSDETERLLVVTGALLSTVAFVASIYRRVASG
jgi:hypothetical protein